jgi:hypothetical protein
MGQLAEMPDESRGYLVRSNVVLPYYKVISSGMSTSELKKIGLQPPVTFILISLHKL